MRRNSSKVSHALTMWFMCNSSPRPTVAPTSPPLRDAVSVTVCCHAFTVTHYSFDTFHSTRKYPVGIPLMFFRAATGATYSPSGTCVPISMART